MATQTKTANETEAATERIRELNEQVLDFGRKGVLSFLEAYDYETALGTFADYQDKRADSTQVDWIAFIAKAQAGVTRDVSQTYATTARDPLK